MAKKKTDEKEEVTKVGEDVVKVEQTEFTVPKGSIVDLPVTVIAVNDPFHKKDEEFQLGKKTAEELQERGWVKIKEEKK